MVVHTNYLTATGARRLIAEGELTVEQLAKDHLERYRQRDGKVKAWAHIDEERILGEARRLDAIPADQRGPLFGVVLGVKDMMDTEDMPTQHGSGMWKGNRPGTDSTVVAVARAAHALIYAKSHTAEFAFSMMGPETMNPYDRTRTPGGSSSGSAAAVRDYQCQVALGTQTGGSMIRPATYNGIYGFKPTWGTISKEGIKVVAPTLDTIGIFARSLADIELVAGIYRIVDTVSPVPPKPLSKCRFRFIKTQAWDLAPNSAELENAWKRGMEVLRTAGAEVEEEELGEEFDGLVGKHSASRLVNVFEARTNLLYEVSSRSRIDAIRWDTREIVEGKTEPCSARQVTNAYDRLARLRPRIDEIAGGYDAIITPSAPSQATVGLDSTGDSRFCAMWTALHVPVVNIPGFAGEDGLPIGLSLVAPRCDDQRLLSIAKSVAAVFIGVDEAKLNSLAVPSGTKNLEI